MFLSTILLYLSMFTFSAEQHAPVEEKSCMFSKIIYSDEESKKLYDDIKMELLSIIKNADTDGYGFTSTLILVANYQLKENGEISLYYDGVFRFYDDFDVLTDKTLVENQLIHVFETTLPLFETIIDKNKIEERCTALVFKQDYRFY